MLTPFDLPELVPVIEEAIDLVARFGKPAVPMLMEKLDEGDLKSQIAIAQTLGRIGADVVEPLVVAYEAMNDASRRAFILYALGKVKSPRVLLAAGCVLEAAESANMELRDTATRAIGKFVESIPPFQLPLQTKKDFLESSERIWLIRTMGFVQRPCVVWGSWQSLAISTQRKRPFLRRFANEFLELTRNSNGTGRMS